MAKLMAHLEFALAYRNQQRLSSEAHYFVVTLTSAVHFLLELDSAQVDMDPEEFHKRMSTSEREQQQQDQRPGLGRASF